MPRRDRQDPELEDLLEQCADIRVKLSLILDRDVRDDGAALGFLNELSGLEARIARKRSAKI
jgi:hypothetical protein